MGGGALFINTYRRAAVVVFIYYNISGGAAAVFIIYSLIIKGDERGIYLLKCVRAHLGGLGDILVLLLEDPRVHRRHLCVCVCVFSASKI